MTSPKIVVTHRIHAEVARRLEAAGRLVINEGSEPWSADTLRAQLADADAMMGFMTDRVDATLLDGAPRLRIVACALKGYDSYDVAACSRAGVWMSIVPDLLTAPTAELAVGLAIALARQVPAGDALVRSGAHQGWRARLYGAGLENAVVGIVGMGQVGRAIAQRLQGFNCSRVLGSDVVAATVPGVQPVTLAQALADSEFLFVAAPLTDRNRHMLGEAEWRSCRSGQFVINVGRGSVVDEHAVAGALQTGRLGGYAADVFEFEDWGRADRPEGIDPLLLAAPNTLFTPHLGSAVARVRLAIEQRAADNIVAVLAGRAPPDAINAPTARRGGPRRAA